MHALKPTVPLPIKAVTNPKIAALLSVAVSVLIQGWYIVYYHRLNPINQDGFVWIDSLGGGQDEWGYYRYPVRSGDAFGVILRDGWHEAQMLGTNGNVSILYYVQGGYIIRQDYDWRY